MKRLLFLVCICLLMMQTVSAVIPIAATNVSCTYIKWEWTSAELVDMYIDGNVMCGYDTLAQEFLLTDLNPGEMHTIQLITAGDTGTNTVSTLSDCNITATGGFSSAAQDDSLFWTLAFVSMLGLVGIVVVKVK